jgi:hydrogenase expression/formation protein HypD
MKADACMNRIVQLADEIGRPVQLMEVCGTHTMAAFRTGLRSLLPKEVSLLSGPGCPVCVTPTRYLDRAIAIAREPDTIVMTFGDMMRVPGTESSLDKTHATGADIRVVYSPLDAITAAQENPDKRVVFLGVGFETTMPTVAWTLKEAITKGISNYSILCTHKVVPPAMAALLSADDTSIDGFMCPGHVSVIIGSAAYEPLCKDYHVPCVVAGFEAKDMAMSIMMLLEQIVAGKAAVEVEYSRSVTAEGNQSAQAVCSGVFEVCDAEWRGVGVIPGSGMRIRDEYSAHDAGVIFANLPTPEPRDDPGCLCGEVLRGVKKPTECGKFGKSCTPASPVGACMVSSEGSCAAYYRFSMTEND